MAHCKNGLTLLAGLLECGGGLLLGSSSLGLGLRLFLRLLDQAENQRYRQIDWKREQIYTKPFGKRLSAKRVSYTQGQADT